jgi:hypothetical protein
MSDPSLWIVVIAFSCLAGVIAVLSGRYSGGSVSLYDYIKRVYPKEYEDLLRRSGMILTVVGSGGARVPTEIGLLKSRFGYQFKVLKQIAQINPKDQELQRYVANMSSTLKIALSLLYGVLGAIVIVFIVCYALVTK